MAGLPTESEAVALLTDESLVPQAQHRAPDGRHRDQLVVACCPASFISFDVMKGKTSCIIHVSEPVV